MIKSVTIKEAYIPELIEVFGEDYQTEIWDDENINMIPNPQTKAQYASDRFDADWKAYITARVQSYRRRIADMAVNTESIIE